MSAAPRPLPRPLAPGARIGVMAPAGPCDSGALAAGVEVLRGAGYEVVCAPNAATRTGHLAGADRDRIAGIAGLLDDGVDCLLAARGGYGTMRLLPDLPWERLAAWSGWVVGFSDITALHAALATRFPRATLHGPMAASLGRDARSAEMLLAWLSGRAPRRLFELRRARALRPGIARGVAVGGTLSILAALAGTPFEPDYEDGVLFIEDVAEPLYRLDRLLTQLRLSSRLLRVKAVVVGRLARCGRGEVGWRERFRELLLDSLPADAVVVEGASFGHGGSNVPFPLGVEVEVDTPRGEISWGGG
ncbi:MAG TPA: LD-carboxypeptidase [Thermoanaerobaculaceae bacterium]|nr:LD-carboxypeptidase [Thermoanaerobaculaceae bacterium]